MKIAFVDDDKECLEELARLCQDFAAKNHCPVEIFPFSSGESFLEAFEKGAFSIVFMDIYMKGMDGIAAAAKLREEDPACLLAFLTSSREFMPDAFSCHAFEYITKPVSFQRIADVLKDALKILPVSRSYIELSSSRKTVRAFLDEIVSIVTDAHYLDIHLADGTALRSRMTISEFMERTRWDVRFISVNKGITLNADYIAEFENNCCILSNGSRFPVRIRDRRKTEQAVEDYNFWKIRSRQGHRT
ncbi:MAG: response regulator transcription factor [Lachnospiraceae bacterium]|nr:response regulator transcription factor [Lachnospiraceae bacterium]